MKKRRIDYFACAALFFVGVVLCTQMKRNALRTQGNVEKEGVYNNTCNHIQTISEFAPLMSYVDSIGNLPPTMGRIDTALQVMNIHHKDVVLAQVAIESAYAKSGLVKSNANLFGMKVAKRRATTNNGEKYGYATYKNWAYSLLDYALWQDRYMNGLNKEQYLEKLSKVYATDTNYVEKIINIINKQKN